MLLLYIFLLSCCLSGSMGRTTEEFQRNFKALVTLAKEEVFLSVPVRKFECSRVPCHLKRTVGELKDRVKDSEMRKHISLMEKNVDHIISTLNKECTNPEKFRSNEREVPLQKALKLYKKFFKKLHEKC